MTPQRINRHLVVVARQAGTASAFVPLFEDIRKGEFGVRTFAFSPAHKVFADNLIESKLIDCFDGEVFRNLVSTAALMLTGTSEFAGEDYSFWHWAKMAGVPSVAFVDSWVSYWQRFTPAGSIAKFSYAPDFIAVIDQFMHDRMVDCGCDPRRLLTTGSPAFDALQRYAPKERASIVREYGKDYVLFAGEPFNSRLNAGSERDARGYTEAEVLTLAAEAVETMDDCVAKLVYRPHPRSGPHAEIATIVKNCSNAAVETGQFKSWDLIGCAGAVLGMTSMMLYEAAVMGVPALSIQPGSKISSDVIELTRMPVVHESSCDAVRQALHEVLSSPRQPLRTGYSTLYDTICDIAGSGIPSRERHTQA